MPRLRCESCGNEFRAQRTSAKYCGPTCRSRAHRAKPAEQPAPAPVTRLPFSTDPFRSNLEQTVINELERAERLHTVAGQQAVALAAQLSSVMATPSGMASVSKELSRVMETALAGMSKEDSVDELRAIRD